MEPLILIPSPLIPSNPYKNSRFTAAQYYISVNSLEEATSWLKQGMEACPER